MDISCIVGTAKNGVIGKDNDIPWHLSADLRYFKKTTLNHHILMGRTNYLSIGRPLPKRTNIIVTRDPSFIVSNCLVVHSIEEGIALALENGETELFIIGGGSIYEQTIDICNKLYLTEIDLEVDGDVFFPKIDFKKWTLLSEEAHLADEKNPYNYSFKVFERKN